MEDIRPRGGPALGGDLRPGPRPRRLLLRRHPPGPRPLQRLRLERGGALRAVRQRPRGPHCRVGGTSTPPRAPRCGSPATAWTSTGSSPAAASSWRPVRWGACTPSMPRPASTTTSTRRTWRRWTTWRCCPGAGPRLRDRCPARPLAGHLRGSVPAGHSAAGGPGSSRTGSSAPPLRPPLPAALPPPPPGHLPRRPLRIAAGRVTSSGRSSAPRPRPRRRRALPGTSSPSAGNRATGWPRSIPPGRRSPTW